MADRPILFSAPMVRALLAGTKTQTRRVAQPKRSIEPMTDECPYGVPGDRLWVREAWRTVKFYDQTKPRDLRRVIVRCEADKQFIADGTFFLERDAGKLRPGMFMPRWASRITLEVTGVRVERLQEISEADAKAEGAPHADLISGRETIFPKDGLHRWGFRLIWENINGPDSWRANPWVWVVEFRRV